ncbi:glycosyltransferase family 39 protein [Thermodesulfobacteriota bacterium]
MRTKRFNLALIVGFLFIGVLHFSSVNNELNGLGGDNAGYVLLAKSLASFEGYRDFSPGNPPNIHWHPAFAVLLTPFVWLFGVNFTVFHIIVVLTELAALILIFFLFKRQEGEATAVFCCVLFALNPFVNLSLVRILTEFPCLMLTAAALLVAEKDKSEKDSTIQYIWLPLLVTGVYLFRKAGLSFLMAYTLYYLYRKQFKRLIWNAPILFIPYVLWMIRSRLSGKPDSYIVTLWLKNYRDPALGNVTFLELIERIRTNILNTADGIADFVLPISNDHSPYLLLAICVLIILGFIWRAINKKIGLMEFYVMIYLMVLFIWPVYEPRKLMPVIPFLYLYLFLGINWMIKLILFRKESGRVWAEGEQRILRTPVAARVLGILLIGMQVLPTMDLLKIRSKPIYLPQPNDPQYKEFTIDWSHYRETFYWMKTGSLNNLRLWADYFFISHLAGTITPPGSVIIARKRTLTALYSGRPATGYPFYKDFDKQRKNIIENNVDYILLDGFFRDTYKYLVPYIQAHPDGFRIAARRGNAYLLKVFKDRLLIKKE